METVQEKRDVQWCAMLAVAVVALLVPNEAFAAPILLDKPLAMLRENLQAFVNDQFWFWVGCAGMLASGLTMLVFHRWGEGAIGFASSAAFAAFWGERAGIFGEMGGI